MNDGMRVRWFPALLLATAPACKTPAPASPSTPDASVRVIDERTEELTLPSERQHAPDPRAEAALRRHIDGVLRGEPNYGEMAPGLAQAVREHPGAVERVARMGAIQTVTFRGKHPRGGDSFDVTTEGGVSRWYIRLDSSGTTVGLHVEPARPRVVPSEAELVEQVRAELDRAAASDDFSGVVLLARDGEPVFERARGLADREGNVPVDLQTKFRIGSMSKMFTAVALFQLAEAGKLSLDDKLEKWLPDYPNAELARRVSLRHLLSHVGGTGDIFGPEFDEHRKRLLTHRDYVELYGERGLKFEPGGGFDYSNYGFVLLGRVIEEASGQSYYDYVDAHVFGPAGMHASGSPLESDAVERRSVGYHGSRGKRAPNRDRLPPRATAAGGGLSTAGDLLRFARALTGHVLLSEESTRQLLTRQVPLGPGVWYAHGFFEHERDGVHFFGHGGGFAGMNADFKIFPESGHVLVVLANLDPPAAGALAEFVTARLPRTSPEIETETAGGDAASGAPAAERAAPSGPNLVQNGDLSSGPALWSTSLWLPFEEPKARPSRVEAGALCATVGGGENVIVGWPGDESGDAGFSLAAGQRYRLSFRASSSGPLELRVVAKVGHVAAPYTAAVQAPIPVTAEAEHFALDFEPGQADDRAGVAFILSAPRGEGQTEACFDDVAVRGESP